VRIPATGEKAMKYTAVLIPKDSKISLLNIISFVKEKGIILSDEYVNFILQFDQSSLLSKYFLIKRKLQSGFIQEFYLGDFLTFEEFIESYCYFYETEIEEELVELKVAIIGSTNGRTLICIGIEKSNLGQIFLWDGDFGVTKQANNLEEFFNSLTLDTSSE